MLAPVAGALICVLAATGCGAARAARTPIPTRVPPGAVAIVGATPVAGASFAHWLAIVRQGNPVHASPRERNPAVTHTVSFLVKAQWLLQEARAEGIDESVLNKLVAARAGRAGSPGGLAGADGAFQIRLDLIAEALRNRHSSKDPRTLRAFVHAYETRWRARTLCAPGYVVRECRNSAPP